MARCRVDTSIGRVEMDGFPFPLGVYPVEEMSPRAGFTLAFEPADGGEGDGDASGGGGLGGDHDEDGGGSPPHSSRARDPGDEITGGMPDGLANSMGGMGGLGGGGSGGGGAEWEEWPDRYVFDILVPSTRVEALCRALFALLPGRVYPILDVLGHDEYREVDPYVSYDLLGMDRFIDSIRRYRGFFYEDGLVGFGAMSDEPFLYIFIDEHKIVTVRAEVPLREKVEQILAAFDLEQVDQIAGADSVTHEHRSVLDAPEDRLDLLTPDEIVEDLQEDWRLELNVNPDNNVDEEGQELGMTGWRCIIRFERLHRMDDPSLHPPEPETEAPAGKLAALAGTPLSEKAARKSRKDEPVSEAGSGEQASGPSMADPAATPSAGVSDRDRSPPPTRYAEVLLTAENLATAQDLALQAVIDLEDPGTRRLAHDTHLDDEFEPFIVLLTSDRLRPENFAQAVREVTKKKPSMDAAKVWSARWVA